MAEIKKVHCIFYTKEDIIVEGDFEVFKGNRVMFDEHYYDVSSQECGTLFFLWFKRFSFTKDEIKSLKGALDKIKI